MLSQLPTIEEAARRMRQKELTPLDLVEHCLARIAQFEDRIHAWVLVDEEGARKEARRLGDMLARGEDLGPLHGMPIGIKDIIDVAGWQTKCGSKLRENVPPAEKDATVVANLRGAGAIILGKTVTTEFACFDPPPTRNPWNLDHTPGGSSSGSAAAVATEMCMAAIGTQTGGSIIRPAAYCGICGYKPSFEPRLMWGIMPLTLHLDHVGPMARTVADTITVASAIVPPWFSTFDWLKKESARKFDFTYCEEYFAADSSPTVWQAFEAALEKLRQDGHRVKQVPPIRSFDRVHQMHRRIMAVEAARIHRQTFEKQPECYSQHVAALLSEGLSMPAMDYADAIAHWEFGRRNNWRWLDTDGNIMHQGCALLTPATATTAPALDTTGDPKFNSPFSFYGMPSATVPIGTNAEGLPIGLQLVSRSGQWVLIAALIAERCSDWNRVPSLLDGVK